MCTAPAGPDRHTEIIKFCAWHNSRDSTNAWQRSNTRVRRDAGKLATGTQIHTDTRVHTQHTHTPCARPPHAVLAVWPWAALCGQVFVNLQAHKLPAEGNLPLHSLHPPPSPAPCCPRSPVSEVQSWRLHNQQPIKCGPRTLTGQRESLGWWGLNQQLVPGT